GPATTWRERNLPSEAEKTTLRGLANEATIMLRAPRHRRQAPAISIVPLGCCSQFEVPDAVASSAANASPAAGNPGPAGFAVTRYRFAYGSSWSKRKPRPGFPAGGRP